jgi:hypothetical protein
MQLTYRLNIDTTLGEDSVSESDNSELTEVRLVD